MSNLTLHRTEIAIDNGGKARLVYDKEGDELDIFFGENEPATGVELTDHLLLRLNQTTGRPVSLTILHFSVLAERTEYGPRSYPLNSLKELPEHLRELVVHALTTTPVNRFLKLSYFQASPTKRVPFTYVESSHFAHA
ncbi:MAG: DUF2283 domain-containing protein [Chloroflexota bacterium]